MRTHSFLLKNVVLLRAETSKTPAAALLVQIIKTIQNHARRLRISIALAHRRMITLAMPLPDNIAEWFYERAPRAGFWTLLVWFPDGHVEACHAFTIDGVEFEVDEEDNTPLVSYNGLVDYYSFFKGHLFTTSDFECVDTEDVDTYLAPLQTLALEKRLIGDVLRVVVSFLISK